LDDWAPGAAPDAGFSVRRAIGDPADVQDPAQILLTGQLLADDRVAAW